ncbi:hypothetical protein A2409_03775 [Candidatus Curtissbacteria bacterium RIFOXYC1_FULL_41_36]|nr:MAG: hypothetical protein A2409_03775 [Candidatus Curtissbacteria bacterium RIFOXYC1_FULL_41_36]
MLLTLSSFKGLPFLSVSSFPSRNLHISVKVFPPFAKSSNAFLITFDSIGSISILPSFSLFE